MTRGGCSNFLPSLASPGSPRALSASFPMPRPSIKHTGGQSPSRCGGQGRRAGGEGAGSVSCSGAEVGVGTGRQRRLRQAANSAGESRLLLAGAQTPRSGACGRLARPPPMPRTPQRCLELQEDGTTRHNLPCQAGLGPCPTLPFQKGTLCFDSPPTPPRPGGRCCVFEAFF